MTQEQIHRAAIAYKKKYGEASILYDAYEDGRAFGMELGFKAGANWRINSVWHNAEEAPGKGRIVLTIGELMPLICGPNHENWTNTVVNLKITRWAYVKDLMPAEE